MLYKQYGKLDLRVSAVGFGGMRFDTTLPTAENAELVRYACSMGINYFDTAPGYCGDQSEKIFGEAFKDMPGEYLVSTKGMPVHFDTADKAYDAVRKSLDTMGIPKINFYHVWCLRKMEHYELAMQPGGQYEGLLRCKEEGLIDHIVCSSHQPGYEIRKIVEDGKFDGVLLGMNILNFPYRWDGVTAAYEHGMGVVAMNPLSGGMIPQNEELFSFLAQKGETPTEAALRFVISCPQITVALIGFTTREHVEQACRVADRCTPFTDEDLTRIKSHLSQNLNAVCTACGYCDNCPQGINIPAYMQVYNQKQMFGATDEQMPGRIKGEHEWGSLVGVTAENSASSCIECGQCEEDCTQHLNIIERLKECAAWEAAGN